MAIGQAFRRLRRYTAYLLILTFPFIFQAIITGALWAKWHTDRVTYHGPKLFLREIDSFSYMHQWNTSPDADPRDQEKPSYPFFVTHLHANTWPTKLGLTISHAHEESWYIDAPIDRTIAFDSAVRDVSCHRGHPTEIWIYVSNESSPGLYDWDSTFVELLEYHQKYPTPLNTSFAYVDCATAEFLCHVWQVQYPALMHFKIDEEAEVGDQVDDSAFEAAREDLRPLEVRIFDLGLQLDTSPLPNGIFPSRLEQMKALTTQPGAYAVEETYNELLREYRQFNELYYFPLCATDGSFLDYSSELDYFLLKKVAAPLGLEAAAEFYAGVAVILGFGASSLFWNFAYHAVDLWRYALHQRTELQDLADEIEHRESFKTSGGLVGYPRVEREKTCQGRKKQAYRPVRVSEQDDGMTPMERWEAGVPPPEIKNDYAALGDWLSEWMSESVLRESGQTKVRGWGAAAREDEDKRLREAERLTSSGGEEV